MEEIDEADFGIVGGDVEDVRADEGNAGKDLGKKMMKKKKRKRGDDDEKRNSDDDKGLNGDGNSVVENEQEGEKEKKKTKRKRNRKKRKVKDSEKSGESDEEVTDDNAEGDVLPDCCFEALTHVKCRCAIYSVLICIVSSVAKLI